MLIATIPPFIIPSSHPIPFREPIRPSKRSFRPLPGTTIASSSSSSSPQPNQYPPTNDRHGDVLAPRRHAPAAHSRPLGLPPRPAVQATVWRRPQHRTQELQLPRPQHEEEWGRLLHPAAHARIFAHNQSRCRHVEQPAHGPEVRNQPSRPCPAHPLPCSVCGTNTLCCSPQLATPRRSLFTSNLFQQLDTKGKWLCSLVSCIIVYKKKN